MCSWRLTTESSGRLRKKRKEPSSMQRAKKSQFLSTFRRKTHCLTIHSFCRGEFPVGKRVYFPDLKENIVHPFSRSNSHWSFNWFVLPCLSGCCNSFDTTDESMFHLPVHYAETWIHSKIVQHFTQKALEQLISIYIYILWACSCQISAWKQTLLGPQSWPTY